MATTPKHRRNIIRKRISGKKTRIKESPQPKELFGKWKWYDQKVEEEIRSVVSYR